ncbi:hypothetical protein CVT24_003379 [Panaeolus cyanescens]|uniref:Inositol-pentakisphosphate 2-kinase n=1 Tax=Panaeolus cyanescens TaxID=181874 RepID=A0A409Y6Y7_9AGAR|nr:hypothetical protein CVT24_003379 [Panaeolus cyanescens]
MCSSKGYPDITHTRPEDWKYVSEGGATIVFSYVGPLNPRFDGTVLRLRKAIVPKAGNKGEITTPSEAPSIPTEEPDDPTIQYQEKCMSRVIPSDHLPRLETVHLERSWLERLVNQHDTIRPQGRRDKDQVDLSRTKGVLATDLVGGNWIAVEIKPKWGFLPNLHHLSEASKGVKTQTCRFCMHSAMRHEEGEQVASGYCPLDLFSGEKERIIKAIYALWDAWISSDATINNLKLFQRGSLVKPSNMQSLIAEDYTRDHLEALSIRDAFAEALVQPLLKTPVLQTLSQLQRDLDALDIEGLSKLWRETESSAPLYRTTFSSFFERREGDAPPNTPIGVTSLFLDAPEPNMSDWIEFLDLYLSSASRELDHHNPRPENLRYYLLAYLLSATFKDCSVIVRLDFLKPGSSTQGILQSHTATVIDLDPKSMDKLRNWEKLDQRIVNYYTSLPPSKRKECVDANKTT